MYWPKDLGGVETYGCIQVKLVNEDTRATYTIRSFTIKHLKVLSIHLYSNRCIKPYFSFD